MRVASISVAIAILLLTIGDNPAPAQAAFSTLDPHFQQSDFLTDFPYSLTNIGPTGMVFYPNGDILVADTGDGNLYKFPPGGGSAGTPFASPGTPIGLTFGLDGKLYAARRAFGDVAEINSDTGAVIRVVATGFSGDVRALTTDPLSGNLFVSDNSNSYSSSQNVYAVQPTSGTVSPYTPAGTFAAPDGLVFDSSGLLYVADGGTVVKVDRAGTPSAVYSTAAGVDGIALRRGCSISVSATTVPPHGSFTVTMENAWPGIEYIIFYGGSPFRSIFTADSSGQFNETVSLDQLFGANSPEASSGSFYIDAGTTIALGFPDSEACSGSAVVVTVAGSQPLPPRVTGGTSGDHLFVNTNDGRILRIHMNSSGPFEFATGGSRGDFLAVSPDGYLFATQTDRVIRIGPPTFQPSPGNSPPKSLIAFASFRSDGVTNHIYTLDPEDPINSQTNISQSIEWANFPSWSPDGTKIAFLGPCSVPGPFCISVMNADGSGKRLIGSTNSSPLLKWSPDGTRIGYLDYLDGGFCLAYADGSGQTCSGQAGLDFEWSPVADRIATSGYAEGICSGPCIFTMDPDGGNKQLVVVSRDIGYTPAG